MPLPGQKYGKEHDRRFTAHHTQPRGRRLTKQQRTLCRNDPAFAQALRQRVADPARWDAFMAGESWYLGKTCHRCGSQRRRTRCCGCYSCLLVRGAKAWDLMRQGIMPPAQRSRDSYLDRLERAKREKSGEYTEYACGAFTARQYPTGRLSVVAPTHHINQPDMARLSGQQIHALVDRFPELLEVLRWAGWTD